MIKRKLKGKIADDETIINFLVQGKFYDNEDLKNFINFMFHGKDVSLNQNILLTPFFLYELENNKTKFDALLPLKDMPKNFNNKENTFVGNDYYQINISLNYKHIASFLLFVSSIQCLLKNDEHVLLTLVSDNHIYPDIYFITKNKTYTNLEEIEQRFNNEYKFYINKQKTLFIKKVNK